MSSRKQQATQKQAAAAQLLQAKQIQFWTRSMARNDADLAAVIDLNRSLHAVKRAFSGKRSSSSRNTSSINMDKNKKKEDALGELLLLDLGAGVYRLAPDGRDTLLKKVPTSSLRPDATPLRKFDPNHDSPNPTNAAADRNKDDSKDDLDANADISSNRQHESPTAAAAAQENDETAALFTLQPILESELSLEKQELCVDFLLRSRLRQKLLSRISRRLLRLATTMESTSSSSTACEAPAPPKYGDLRLHCDAQAVLDFTKPRAAQDAAWIRILAAREAATLQALEQQERENEFDNHKEKDDDDEKEREDKDLQEEPVAMESDLEKKDTEANTEGADEDTRMEEHVTHSDATGNEDDPLAADYAMLKEYKDAYERILIASTITTSLPAGGADESAFCSSTTTLTTQYPIIDPSSTGGVMVEEDWMAIKSGAGGIGATHHNLTAREREVEFNRWKTALLARIPEQPTSAELGLEHRVFLEQQRRERVLRRIQKLKEEEEAGNSLEEDEEEEHENDGEPTELVTDEKSDEEESVDELSGDAAAQQSPVSEKLLDGIKAQANKEDGNIVAVNLAMDENDEQEHVKNDDFDLDGDNNGEIVEEVVADKEADHKIVDKDAEGDVENTQGNITASNDIKKEHEPAKTAEPGEPLASKVVRPISFMATPSFYEQDLKRIKLVHADLMSSSMRDYAVHRLEEATEEFNQALKNSMELADNRIFLQAQINAFVSELKGSTDKMQNEYRAKLQMQVRAWNNGRVQFEMNKLNRLLPSRNGLSPFGTQLIQHYRTRPDRVSLSEIVGGCLADIVDCVEGIAQGVVLNERYGSILPPPAQSIATPDAAEHQQKTKALEAARRTDFNAVTLRLRTSEGERLRAWRKILKTKAEFDIPHHHVSSHGSVKIIQLDQHNCTTLALPALTLAARQSVPQEFAGRSSIASYTPLHTVRTAPVGSLTMSDSKYSTARVRERIAVDGTVAPVTEPKITKDGLFQRPVGRTRKGMKWDSVRGIWIPTPELS